MRITIDPESKVPLHAQIAEKIQLSIAVGDLLPGDQLPTVRQLSVDLKVNSNTVAKVYSELERTGILETRRGKGTFVRERPKIAVGARDKRLRSLCRSFVQICSEEGFSLEEVREALRALAEKKEDL